MGHSLAVVLLVLCIVPQQWLAEHHPETCDDNVAPNILQRISTTGIGEVQEISLQSHKYELKTLSFEPLAFEIPNYLTNDECDEIIKMSKRIGLQDSVTHRNKHYGGYKMYGSNC